MRKRPNFTSGKCGYDVTEHFEKGGHHVTGDKLSTLKPRWTKNTWTDRIGVSKAHRAICQSKRLIGWTERGAKCRMVCSWVDGLSRHQQYSLNQKGKNNLKLIIAGYKLKNIIWY
jgi:hypothetical protein